MEEEISTTDTNKASVGDWKTRQQDELQKRQLEEPAGEEEDNVIVGSVGNTAAEVKTRGNVSNPREQ